MFFFKIFITFILFFILFLGKFLDTTSSPKKVDTIFALGGYENFRIIKALNLLNQGFSTSNKIFQLSTLKQQLWLARKDIKVKNIIQNSKQIEFTVNLSNTMQELKYIEKILDKNKYKSFIIVTDPSHSRRVDFLIKNYTNIKDNYKYNIISSEPIWWNKNFYFLNLKALGTSILEIFKILHNYTKYSLIQNSSTIKYLDYISNTTKSYLHKNFGF